MKTITFLADVLNLYFVPTEESFSWLDGRTEFPAAVEDANGFCRVVATVPAGLEISGLCGLIIICGLGSEFAIFVGILLVDTVAGTPLDEEAGIPSRDAIIRARS